LYQNIKLCCVSFKSQTQQVSAIALRDTITAYVKPIAKNWGEKL
jgi:hypothetical protein